MWLLGVVVRRPHTKKRAFVCACSCMCSLHNYGCRGTPVVAGMCVYTVRKNYLLHKM